MNTAAAWMAARTAGAPAALRARAEEYLGQVPEGGTTAARLAAAARLALGAVLVQGQERSAALDLLAADSLVTLALLSQAEEAPAELERFAADLVHATAA
jgi:hypothetical protein